MIYSAFGLAFQSVLRLSGLRLDPETDRLPDVIIRVGIASCPEGLESVVPAVRAGPGIFWMEIARVGRFLVSDGCEITVDPAPGVAAATLNSFLLGSALGALLHQRGLTPIHACTVAIGTKVVAFVGASGAGKSTLALHLGQRGHRVLGDDICAVDLRDDTPVVWPGPTSIKLCRDALERAALDASDREPVSTSEDKFFHTADTVADYRAYRLDMVVRLAMADGPALLAPIEGSEAVTMLVANTYRGHLVPALGLTSEHWRRCVRIVGLVECAQLSRPWSAEGITESVGILEKKLPCCRSNQWKMGA